MNRFCSRILPSLVLLLTVPPASCNEDLATRAEIAERRLAAHPKDWDAWSELLSMRLAMGDFDRAEALLEKWRIQKPAVTAKLAEIDRLEGNLAKARNQFDQAIACWNRALEKGADKVTLFEKIAQVRMEQENWEDAVEAWSEILGLLSRKATANKQSAWLQKTELECLVKRSECFVRLRNWERAREDIQRANALDPTSESVQKWYPLFESYDTWITELKALDRGVTESSTMEEQVTRLLARSVFFLRKSLPALAAEDAKQAHHVAPAMLRTRFWKGICAHWNNKPEEASPIAMPAQADEQQNYRAWILAADQIRLIQGLDALKDADQQADVLLRLRQPYFALAATDFLDGSVLRAKAFRALKETVQARRAAQRAAELHPDSPQALLIWAESEFENGNIRETLELTAKIISLKDAHWSAEAARLREQASAARGIR
jgi:tetratricopeptide (TPR) repeat protein